ncbi:MAG: peptide chain release factor-like protein [Bacteroidia bacterium]
MLKEDIINAILDQEVVYRSSRSGGPGGQNVNKVETKVELTFYPEKSTILTQEQINRILRHLSTHTKSQFIRVTSQKYASQLKNKEECNKKFVEKLAIIFKEERKRIKTKPGKSKVEKRLKDKKSHSEKKERRRFNY